MEQIPYLLFFFNGDGQIPNSDLPLVVYPRAMDKSGEAGAQWLEKRFRENNWTNSWRWGIYPFHHFHSNTHEVLGVFQGSAQLRMGGEAKGQNLEVQAGDIIVIPAGVGHKCLSSSVDFTVVGAYPNGLEPDLKKGEKREYEEAVKRIEKIPLPDKDPLQGASGGILKLWKF